MVEPPDNSIVTLSNHSSPHTGEGVVIDIGTGDGLFVYQSARINPTKFYIGIDANPRPLAKVSEKIHRKPAKGGLKNVLFLQASIENLPHELDGLADEVHIHFPWGSLLRAVAAGDDEVLKNLSRICSPHALLEILIGLDPIRDTSEIARLELEPLTLEQIDSVLAPRYICGGFEIVERDIIPPEEWPELQSSWAKRLRGRASRSLVYIIARAVEQNDPGTPSSKVLV